MGTLESDGSEMSHKLNAVKSCMRAALRRYADKYVMSLDDDTVSTILDNVNNGQVATIRLNIPVVAKDIAPCIEKAASTPIFPVGKSNNVSKTFVCDVYLVGSPGKWRDRAAAELKDHSVCDPVKNLRKEPSSSSGFKNDAMHEVPNGVDAQVVLCVVEDGCDDPNVIGGLLTTVWFHGISTVVVLGDIPQKDLLAAVCQLAGAHSFDSLDDALEETARIVADGVGPDGVGPDGVGQIGDEIVATTIKTKGGETVVRLPSGNQFVIQYYGTDQHADRLMLFGRSTGVPHAAVNLDLIVPDPDRNNDIVVQDGKEMNTVDVHRIRVRHHGPTDDGTAILPKDFLPNGGDLPSEPS